MPDAGVEFVERAVQVHYIVTPAWSWGDAVGGFLSGMVFIVGSALVWADWLHRRDKRKTGS